APRSRTGAETGRASPTARSPCRSTPSVSARSFSTRWSGWRRGRGPVRLPLRHASRGGSLRRFSFPLAGKGDRPKAGGGGSLQPRVVPDRHVEHRLDAPIDERTPQRFLLSDAPWLRAHGAALATLARSTPSITSLRASPASPQRMILTHLSGSRSL